MLNFERKWLAAVPWQTVVTMNQELCQKDEQPHAPKAPGYETARRLWEEATDRSMKLSEALDLYRQVHKLAPFQFFNGNTVAAVAKTMMAEVLGSLTPVQATMARSTVSHYVVGAIKPAELADVFGHLGQVWRNTATAPSRVIAPTARG